MNSRFLLVVLYAFILSFGVQYFFFPKNTMEKSLINQWVVLQIDKEKITIPNIPKVELVNHSTGSIGINTCNDIILSIDSNPITDIATVAPEFCENISIVSGEKKLLPFSKLYKVFSTIDGKYSIRANTSFWERTVNLTVSKPSAIRSAISGVFYEPIYNLFVGILTFLPGHSLGLAIILITLTIRLILLAPQHHMLMSQKKLQVIQPKIKALQKQYKDDQAKLGMEMLELYKKEGVNPMGSCLPLLIQMPILIGLYWVISGANDPSNFYHLYSFFQSFNPALIDSHFLGLNLQHVWGMVGFAFSVTLAAIQWLQAKLSTGYNPPVKKTEKTTEWENTEMALDPAMMQNMMLYMMPIMIGISSYFFPLGVGLYWFIGTIFVIIQQWYVNVISKKKGK